MPEVRLGVPTIVGALRLPDRVGMQHALELLLTGDRIDADAREARSASRAGSCPRDGCWTRRPTSPSRLCQGAPLAVRAVKEMAHRGQRLPWTDAVRFGETMRRVVHTTEDAAEGMAAAAERRAPHWQGK